MSKVQILRSLVNQRLSAAAEEIFGLFERTIAEYEEETRRQQKVLETVLKPKVQSHRADDKGPEVKEEEALPEQQESSSCLKQKNPAEPENIKLEQEEVWCSQEREQLQEPEEDDVSMVTFFPVSVKREEEEQFSQLDEIQSEKVRDTEHLKTKADVEDCGGSEPDRDLNPHTYLQPVSPDEASLHSGSDTDDSGDWEEGDEPQEGSNSLKNKDETIGTSVSSSESAPSTGPKNEDKQFSCSICGKKYSNEQSLSTHISRHSKEHRFSCSVCKKGFPWKGELEVHMRFHTGEKPFSCSVCGRGFSDMSNLVSHFKSHKGAVIFPCSTCKKSFVDRQALLDHTRIHTERQRSCSFCGKTFASNVDLERHVRVHTGEKPYSCSVCGKSFAIKHYLEKHLTVHTGEKRFSCSLCGKRFSQDAGLRRHSIVHTGEKRFSCDICDRRFTQLHSVKKHKMIFHQSEPNPTP